MKKIILVLIPLMMIFSCFSQIAIADGGVFGYHYQTIYHPENSQSAIINYKNGVQKMLISVNFTWSESDKSAWILPVPSKPEDTDVDVIDGTPTFSGYDVKEDAKEELKDDLAPSLLCYLYPLVLPFLYVWTSGFMAGGGAGVQVYKHLEKEGITVEVVSATEGEGLHNYLTDKGLNVSEGVIPQLDSYVSKNYTFVISWVSSSDKTMREPGIVIEFPTNKIYYPMILTSIYGSDVIPIDVIVMGHVTPEVYPEIKEYTKVTYWKGEVKPYSYYPYSPPSSDLKNFTYEITSGWDGRFTRIEISAPSNTFKQDLWIENKKPWNVEYAETVHETFDENFLPTILLLFLLLSFITSLICGPLIISRKKEKIPFYLLIGLCNMGFGWIGMIIATHLLRKHLAAPAGRLAAFVSLYVLLFILLVFVSFGIIALPLIF